MANHTVINSAPESSGFQSAPKFELLMSDRRTAQVNGRKKMAFE